MLSGTEWGFKKIERFSKSQFTKPSSAGKDGIALELV